MFNLFRSYSNKYWQNIDGSGRTYARRGIFELPGGGEEPAVIIFRDRYCLAVLTVEDATRVSNELIDAIEGI